MATRLLTPCAKPGCPAATHDRFCAPHAAEERRRYEQTRPSAVQRGYGQEWRRLRRLVLARDPICRICFAAPSTEADHIVLRRRGGPNTLENLQGACKPCHSHKTAANNGGYGNPVG